MDSFTCYQHNLWTGYLQLGVISMWLGNEFSATFLCSLYKYCQACITSRIAVPGTEASLQTILVAETLNTAAGNSSIMCIYVPIGCVDGCEADQEEKNSEITTNERRKNDGKKMGKTRGPAGVNERRGRECTYSKHNLHFQTRTWLWTQCPIFIFFLKAWNFRK